MQQAILSALETFFSAFYMFQRYFREFHTCKAIVFCKIKVDKNAKEIWELCQPWFLCFVIRQWVLHGKLSPVKLKIWEWWIIRSTRAAVSLASVNIRFHWLNSRLEVMIRLFSSYQSVTSWNNSSAPSLLKGHSPSHPERLDPLYWACFWRIGTSLRSTLFPGNPPNRPLGRSSPPIPSCRHSCPVWWQYASLQCRETPSEWHFLCGDKVVQAF